MRGTATKLTGRRTTVLSLLSPTVILVGGLFLAGFFHVGGATADDQDVEVVGTLILNRDGMTVVDDGVNSYSVVTPIFLSPFDRESVTLVGGLDARTLFVRELTLGDVAVQEQGGRVSVTATGVVEEADGGLQMTVEGVTFQLVGTDDLTGAIGHKSEVSGELFESEIVVSDLIITDRG